MLIFQPVVLVDPCRLTGWLQPYVKQNTPTALRTPNGKSSTTTSSSQSWVQRQKNLGIPFPKRWEEISFRNVFFDFEGRISIFSGWFPWNETFLDGLTIDVIISLTFWCNLILRSQVWLMYHAGSLVVKNSCAKVPLFLSKKTDWYPWVCFLLHFWEWPQTKGKGIFGFLMVFKIFGRLHSGKFTFWFGSQKWRFGSDGFPS